MTSPLQMIRDHVARSGINRQTKVNEDATRRRDMQALQAVLPTLDEWQLRSLKSLGLRRKMVEHQNAELDWRERSMKASGIMLQTGPATAVAMMLGMATDAPLGVAAFTAGFGVPLAAGLAADAMEAIHHLRYRKVLEQARSNDKIDSQSIDLKGMSTNDLDNLLPPLNEEQKLIVSATLFPESQAPKQLRDMQAARHALEQQDAARSVDMDRALQAYAKAPGEEGARQGLIDMVRQHGRSMSEQQAAQMMHHLGKAHDLQTIEQIMPILRENHRQGVLGIVQNYDKMMSFARKQAEGETAHFTPKADAAATGSAAIASHAVAGAC